MLPANMLLHRVFPGLAPSLPTRLLTCPMRTKPQASFHQSWMFGPIVPLEIGIIRKRQIAILSTAMVGLVMFLAVLAAELLMSVCLTGTLQGRWTLQRKGVLTSAGGVW